MSLAFLGSVVSLDCGEVLGTYQGQVKRVDQSTQTLTISKPYRNGLRCEVDNITLNASDIKAVKILQSGSEAEALVSKEATPSKLSPENSDAESCPSPVKICDINRTQNGFVQQKPSGRENLKPSHGRNSANSDRYSPRVNGNGHKTSPVCFDGLTGGNIYNRYSPSQIENSSYACNINMIPSRDDMMQRRNSSSTSERSKKATTPRKIEARKKFHSREDCFSCPTDSMLTDFDFESNLALFNKKAVFKEIEDTNPKVVKNEQKKAQKYRCDENVLGSKPVTFQQIKVNGEKKSSSSFVTDNGLVVPTISFELRSQLIVAAEKSGFKADRLIEMVGRSACEMVLQLIGGSSRLNPKNGHQLPNIAVLCGPHMQGAQGVSCARQLSNHNVRVHLFVPNYSKMNKVVEDELALYSLCEGRRTSSPEDLMNGPMDMIISAMDSEDNLYLREQTWFKILEGWCSQSRAPVLALDPPRDGGTIPAKWCLSVGLPLDLPSTCSHYLCDLGLPKKVFTDVGIKYVSPFSHKFVIPLHPNS